MFQISGLYKAGSYPVKSVLLFKGPHFINLICFPKALFINYSLDIVGEPYRYWFPKIYFTFYDFEFEI